MFFVQLISTCKTKWLTPIVLNLVKNIFMKPNQFHQWKHVTIGVSSRGRWSLPFKYQVAGANKHSYSRNHFIGLCDIVHVHVLPPLVLMKHVDLTYKETI